MPGVLPDEPSLSGVSLNNAFFGSISNVGKFLEKKLVKNLRGSGVGGGRGWFRGLIFGTRAQFKGLN